MLNYLGFSLLCGASSVATTLEAFSIAVYSQPLSENIFQSLNILIIMSTNNTATRRNCRKWTPQEDEVILRYVRNYPHNLARCFLAVSEQLTADGTPRTSTAVASRWYTVLSKKADVWAFFTASSQHMSRNRKNGMGISITQSIWQRLLNILRSL